MKFRNMKAKFTTIGLSLILSGCWDSEPVEVRLISSHPSPEGLSWDGHDPYTVVETTGTHERFYLAGATWGKDGDVFVTRR